MHILFFLVACIGLTHIIIDSSIFAKARGWIIDKKIPWLTELLSCYMCCGLHVSILLSFVYNPLDIPWYLSMWMCGFAGSYAAMFGAAVLNWLDSPMINAKQETKHE